MFRYVDLIKGIGIAAGLDVIDIDGATGYIDTDYKEKAKKSLEVLKEKDFVYIHVEAPDECGHRNEMENKIKAIEDLDEKLLSYLLDNIEDDFKLMILPDHPTPLSLRTHTKDPVPYMIYDSTNEVDSGCSSFDEDIEGEFIDKGHELMGMFLKK